MFLSNYFVKEVEHNTAVKTVKQRQFGQKQFGQNQFGQDLDSRKKVLPFL
jgi:hypothetical protein